MEVRNTIEFSNLVHVEQLNARQYDPSVKNAAAKLFDEPELGIVLGDTLEFAYAVRLCSSLSDSLSGSAKDDVEVHTENTS